MPTRKKKKEEENFQEWREIQSQIKRNIGGHGMDSDEDNDEDDDEDFGDDDDEEEQWQWRWHYIGVIVSRQRCSMQAAAWQAGRDTAGTAVGRQEAGDVAGRLWDLHQWSLKQWEKMSNVNTEAAEGVSQRWRRRPPDATAATPPPEDQW